MPSAPLRGEDAKSARRKHPPATEGRSAQPKPANLR